MSILDSLYNELTRKAQLGNRDISREIVEDWVGNAGNESHQIAFISIVLTELVSGRYTPDKMAEDMLQLACLDN